MTIVFFSGKYKEKDGNFLTSERLTVKVVFFWGKNVFVMLICILKSNVELKTMAWQLNNIFSGFPYKYIESIMVLLNDVINDFSKFPYECLNKILLVYGQLMVQLFLTANLRGYGEKFCDVIAVLLTVLLVGGSNMRKQSPASTKMPTLYIDRAEQHTVRQ